jgi:hypothetical protein
VFSEAVLLTSLGSIAGLATEAVFVINPAVLGVTTISTVAVAVFANVPTEQLTVPFNSEQVPWLAVAEEKVTLGGSTSVTVTPDATSGPLFVTVSV